MSAQRVIDKSADKWKEAIAADGLTWTHISELKQWESKFVADYNIEGIPATYLIDKEGKIYAKNLRGEELETFLAQLYSEQK